MKKRLLYLIIPTITLILEILPYGAVCNFMNNEGEVFRETYSYFSMIPYGYANVTPFIVALSTCAIIVLILLYCFTNKRGFASAAKVSLFVATVLSLCPLLFGISYFSVVGALITISLAAEAVLLLITDKRMNQKP